MRPVPIELVDIAPEMVRRVLAAPDGDLTGESGIEALEVAFWISIGGVPIQASKWTPTNNDVADLQAGKPLWLLVMTAPGSHPPIMMHVGEITQETT